MMACCAVLRSRPPWLGGSPANSCVGRPKRLPARHGGSLSLTLALALAPSLSLSLSLSSLQPMPLPGLLGRCELAEVNLWFGALAARGLHPTKNSPLHYDKDDGLL
eukprot:COSAG01_NODE_699_length_14176_cov_21.100590_16_plen_106_part_00